MTAPIFGYDWDTTDLVGYKSSIANGISNNNYMALRDSATTDFLKVDSFTKLPHNSGTTLELSRAKQKYVYHIPIVNHILYFIPKFRHLGIIIPDHVRDDIMSNRCIVCVEYNREGFMSYDIDEIDRIISTMGLPKNKIIVTHGDFITDKFNNSNYIYHPIDIFPSWVPKYSSVIHYNPKKLYVTYNKRSRLHRLLLIAKLIQYDLFNEGIISLGEVHHDLLTLKKIDPTITRNDMQRVQNHIMFSPDDKNLIKENPAFSINIEHHVDSFVSLVSETLTDSNINFFSEKIYKPISIGHPFILLCSPKSLRRLKTLGFKTFHEYWDESYDDEMDLLSRITKIIHLLTKLQSLSDYEKIEMRKSMIGILAHNQSVFNDLHDNAEGNKNFYSILESVL